MSIARKGQFRTGDGAFCQDTMPEAKQLGRPTTRVGRRRSGLLDQFLLLDQTPKILLVNKPAGERLDAALQLKQRECRRHQLKDDGTVFDL